MGGDSACEARDDGLACRLETTTDTATVMREGQPLTGVTAVDVRGRHACATAAGRALCFGTRHEAEAVDGLPTSL